MVLARERRWPTCTDPSWRRAEKVRTARGSWGQRHRLYLGEINDSQRAAWTKTIDVFDPVAQRTRELAL